MLFILILGITIISSFLSAIVIFGDSPSFRNTPIHKLRKAIFTTTEQITHVYNYLDRKTNGKLLKWLSWLVPSGYLAVVTFCIYQFLVKTIPMVTTSMIGPYYKTDITFIIILVYSSTILAIFSDPGVVSSKKPVPHNYKFQNNQLIFFNDKTCNTCHIVKPPRSKHCSICGHCYLLYDHHCVWVNNCIGYYNYKWFLLFLVANIIMLGYGGYVCYQALIFQFRHNLGGADNGGANNAISKFWKLITKTTDANKITGIFLILCIIFIIITTLFTGLHLQYVYLGVTTNELDKWSEIEHLIRLRALYRVEPPVNNEEPFVEQVLLSSGEPAYLSLKSEEILINRTNINNFTLTCINSMEHELTNVYDKGFWNNLKERL
ncbi:uncharacterized protein SPAPADRAFT_135163 [Spathaspora passalidarum NRRL Y-27907]|uniref:Palmitoyltransferase n=1 Tax=Spathaspora passalidarum (strain NRRL Y-27907 / 11-Y1) TaxID=619300 RepID=G3AJ05_SPAPN|nr:uncharacterized protein SPAPADRAFT_135163 [Spathaspora passalidarum NRRL Y-27907]EGW34517.1 hypothetical protein SPAPADRAFT_135163 [Spathaspora passalidarum NRRL Y-27907]